MKRSGILTLIAVAIITFIYTGCSTGPCIKGNDIVITENRFVGYFSGISSEATFDVIIIQDTIEEVNIEAESNLMPYIYTQVRGSTLVLKTTNNQCIKNHFPIRITVRCRDINYIALTGSGTITGDDPFTTNKLEAIITGSGNIDISVDADDIETDISGSGNIIMNADANHIESSISGSGEINMWGTVDRSDLEISGSGSIRAYGLESNTSYANISGSGSMYLYVNDYLDVVISGSGSVYYQGNPNVNAKITGSGSVIPSN